MNSKRYYEAYDERFRQVHQENLQWFADVPTPIVFDVMERYGIPKDAAILEIGCGEGRDAAALLKKGYYVLATDISPEAIRYCREKYGYEDSFQVMDCLKDRVAGKFDYIFAIAVLHMLVLREDRDGFYRFLAEQLAPDGIAVICTMGDGEMEMESDIRNAFELQKRKHEQTGHMLCLAETSCRMVSFDTFRKEILRNSLVIVEDGFTSAAPDFPQLMYAVVKRV